MADWCTIESDPGVFTELMQKFGVQGLCAEEVLDLSELDKLHPVYGLIFLFQWTKDLKPHDNALDPADCPQIYFAKQEIRNACATQAIINVLLNSVDTVSLGPVLEQFLSFSKPLDPSTRGQLIGQSDEIRAAHNAFARNQHFSFEDKYTNDEDGEDVYHFVGYIGKDGMLWELDGLKSGPAIVGAYNGDDEISWLAAVREVLQERIKEYGEGQIHFNLVALRKDPIPDLEQLLATLSPSDEGYELKKRELEELKFKRKRNEDENSRRRHNYLPFIVEVLKQLSIGSDLDGTVKEARAKKTESDKKKDAAKKQKTKK